MANHPEISARQAAWVGFAWVNGSVLASYAVGFVFLTWLLSEKARVDLLGAWMLLLILIVLLGPWLIWSIQVTHWRLWAYPRVRDVNALKAEARALSVIWPDGHFFERSEFRTARQQLALQRLERKVSPD